MKVIIVSLFGMHWFKTSDQKDRNRLDYAQSTHILVVQFPFFSSPNATDSDLGSRPLASLPFRRPTASSFGLADI